LVRVTRLEFVVFPAASLRVARKSIDPSENPVVEKVADQDPELQRPPTKDGAVDELAVRVTVRPFSEQVPETANVALLLAA
jgi:hypothetical protein